MCRRSVSVFGLRKDGTEFRAECSLSPLVTEEGESPLFFASIRDLTERHKREIQLRQAEKMEAVGQLAGGVAHDLNNLLVVITGFTSLVLEQLGTDDPLRGDLEMVQQAGEKSADLTRQLLAFSRKQHLVPSVLDLNTLVVELESLIRCTIEDQIEMQLVLEPALWRLEADPSQIEQVLLNLSVNARDAMPEGGKLSIGTANVELDESDADEHVGVMPGHYVMLAVTDTGMDEQTRRRIFEPFFSTKAAGRGTGLGLSTVYGIVKQNNGHIWVDSEPGEGTTFKVYLPRVEGEVESVKAEQTRAEATDGSETIMVVEDEKMVLRLVLRALQNKGYQVLTAEHLDEALRISLGHEGPIHLLLTDLAMPGGTGFELARQFAETRPDTRVLYMSGYADKESEDGNRLEQGMEFLEKPFTASVLARKVREVLDKMESEPT